MDHTEMESTVTASKYEDIMPIARMRKGGTALWDPAAVTSQHVLSMIAVRGDKLLTAPHAALVAPDGNERDAILKNIITSISGNPHHPSMVRIRENDPIEAVRDQLESVSIEITGRYRLMEKQGVDDWGSMPDKDRDASIFVVIENIDSISTDTEALSMVSSILRLGRGAHIFVFAASASSEWMQDEDIDNTGIKIIGSGVSTEWVEETTGVLVDTDDTLSNSITAYCQGEAVPLLL